MSSDTVRLLGEGGVEWVFDLPLGEVYADQVKAHTLRPADDESAALLAALLDPAAGDGEPDAETPSELTLGERIEAVNSHAEANALGVELGLTFEEKKPGLDAKKLALHEAAAAGDGEPDA